MDLAGDSVAEQDKRTGIILFAHGSSVEEANRGVHELARQIEIGGPYGYVRAAFLELAQPDLPAAIAQAAAAGLRRVIIIPYFLTMGIHLLNRLATAYGPGLGTAGEARPAFPRPADLAGLEPEALRALGFSRRKGIALIELARGFLNGSRDLENLEDLAESEAMSRLLALKGVGRWSAEYVLLRGLGDWSVFPGDDVGARRHLQTWLQEAGPLNYQDVRRHLARWHPYAGLLYFHGLLTRLAEEGHLS